MKTTIQLRNSAINDLRERTPKCHYWMRDFAPEADREAARPLIQNFASIGLTPRELAAAEFLDAYATYEILDRELAPNARDIDDRSPIEPIPEHKAGMLSAMRMAYLEAAQHYELVIADDKFPNTVRTAVELEKAIGGATPLQGPAKPGWRIKEPERLPGYRDPLYAFLKKRNSEDQPVPRARDVLDEWRRDLPEGYIVEVLSDSIKYYDAEGKVKTATLKAIKQAITGLVISPAV